MLIGSLKYYVLIIDLALLLPLKVQVRVNTDRAQICCDTSFGGKKKRDRTEQENIDDDDDYPFHVLFRSIITTFHGLFGLLLFLDGRSKCIEKLFKYT